LLATQRVKRMCDPHAATSFCREGCNRKSIQAGVRRTDYTR
jgi:hypothetical protein